MCHPSLSGEPLDEDLASSINYLASHQLQDLAMEEITNKYHTLANCASLNVPAVNHSIWGNIGAGVRAQEMKLQKCFRLLTSGITAFARSMDGEPLSDIQQDAMALMCNANFEINCLRKNAIRPALNPKFAALCKASNVQLANYLFGEDLPKQVRELDDEAKMVCLLKVPTTPMVSSYRRQHPYAPYNTRRYAGTGGRSEQVTQRSFLEQGPSQQPSKMRGGHPPSVLPPKSWKPVPFHKKHLR